MIDDYVLTANINTITSLDIHGENIADLTGIQDFIALEILKVNNNDLTTIDLFSNTSLTELISYTNLLIDIDLSNNTALTKLLIGYNDLTELDLSQNTNLTYMNCLGNLNLETVDLRNGNNTNVTSFEARNNPLLSCIFVDDAAYSTTNWTYVEAISTFVETEAECDTVLSVSSDAFEMGVNLYPNPVVNLLTIEISNDIQLEKVSLFDIMGKQIRVEENSTTISFEYLPSGIYLVKLQDTDGNSITKKIIKR